MGSNECGSVLSSSCRVNDGRNYDRQVQYCRRRVDALLPADTSTEKVVDSNNFLVRQAVEEERANLEAASAAYTNKLLYDAGVKSLRARRLEPCFTTPGDNSLIRALTALSDCRQQLLTAGLEMSTSNLVLQFCIKFKCRVELYELHDGTLLECQFQADDPDLSNSSEEPLRI